MKISRKGQLAIMSGVLLLLVGLVIVYFAFSFFAGSQDSLQQRASDELGAKIIEMRSTFSLEDQDMIFIFLRNTGSKAIEKGKVLVYLDDKGLYADIEEPIYPGEVGRIVIDKEGWDVVDGDPGIKAKLVVPGTLITRTMTVIKPDLREG